MDEWTVSIGEGVGPIRLGMTPEEVVAADFPPPDHVVTQPDGTTKESRDLKFPLLIYEDGQLIFIQLDAHCGRVLLLGRSLFDTPTVELMMALYGESPNALYNFETVVFPELGLTFADFVFRDADGRLTTYEDHVDESPIRVLTLAHPFASDAMLADYEPVTFPG